MAAGRSQRIRGHPIGFLVTAAILVLVFGWTFFANPGRPAAADDPAYYQWHTEALLANEPSVLLGIDGPLDMYAGGYRVATPVVGGLMRRILDVAPITPTILIGLGLRVVVPLLLAGFAYRWRRDPLLWHATAFFTASLFPTPPFAGYLDNVMTLLFLGASLYMIEPMRRSWAARVTFVGLLLAAGFTHPTTLAIFCLALFVAAALLFVARGFSLRTTLVDDGWMLGGALAGAALTYGTWKLGVWGVSASLGDAAVPPPADAAFFQKRLGGWLRSFRLPLNGPLFAIGLVGIVRRGRDAMEEILHRITLAWLVPLVGIAGVALELAYPYYRFFNTTTAWLLLIGIGAYLVARFGLDLARRWGFPIVSIVIFLVLGAVVFGNFRSGLDETGWNDPGDAWIKPDERRDLDALRANLAGETRPIVFVVDDENPEEVRIYGFLKRAGNVLRYAVPADRLDETAVYLGSLDNYLAGRPTDRDPYYRELSAASLTNTRDVVGDEDPIVVLADVFNETGSNVGAAVDTEIIHVRDGTTVGGDATERGEHLPLTTSNGALHLVLVIVLGALLLLPGVWLTRWIFPEADWSDLLGLVPALATAAFALVGIAVLGVTASPLTEATAWLIAGVTGLLALAAYLWRGFVQPRLRRRSAT